MASADEFWPGFGEDDGGPTFTCDTTGSLAQDVLNKYGISCSDGIGGPLSGLDIKHMDAIQVIRLSLLEETANSNDVYEPVVNAEGQVEFKKLGEGEGPSDIYYEIQSGTYREDCSGVMVQGKNPMPIRRAIDWKPIWGDGDVAIYDTGFMYNNCVAGAFSQYATIVYDDPHLNTAYNDGIDNLYDIISPWETLIGYAHYLTWPDWRTDSDATINFSDSAKILIEIELSLGELQRRPNADPDLSTNPACFNDQGMEPPENVGVEVPLPENFRFESVRGTTVDKFAGIVGVYVVGRAIDDLRTAPKDNESSATPNMEAAKVWASISKNYDEVFSLEQGRNYVVNYTGTQTDVGNPKIVFADNSRVTDPLKVPTGGSLTFYIDPDCGYAIDENGQARESETAIVLPTGPTSGIIVKQIFVAVELNTPSIIVYHPDGWNNRAYAIAAQLDYQVAPLIVEDKPAPIAFNGQLLDQESSIKDHDPTTAQSFVDTDLELALDRMDAGGGMSLTLSFLDESQVQSLSGALFDYMNSGTGVESTYVCGPNASPELGATGPNGGVVNSIVYSYQDSNSYTISVNCGPILVGGQMASIDGGPALKITESISAKGTVIEDAGNNVYFKVSIDGFGDRIAVNMIPSVIRVGDKVSVSVHNNPVEA